MTTAAVVLLIGGVLYCWWKKGTDADVAVIFTLFGVTLANTQWGPQIVNLMNQVGAAAEQVITQLV